MSSEGSHPNTRSKAAGDKTRNAYVKVQLRPIEPVAVAVNLNRLDLRCGNASQSLNLAYRNANGYARRQFDTQSLRTRIEVGRNRQVATTSPFLPRGVCRDEGEINGARNLPSSRHDRHDNPTLGFLQEGRPRISPFQTCLRNRGNVVCPLSGRDARAGPVPLRSRPESGWSPERSCRWLLAGWRSSCPDRGRP